MFCGSPQFFFCIITPQSPQILLRKVRVKQMSPKKEEAISTLSGALLSRYTANSLEVNCPSLQSFVYLFIFVAPSNYFLAFLSICSHRAGESLALEAGGQKPPKFRVCSIYPALLYAALVADWLIKTALPKFLPR